MNFSLRIGPFTIEIYRDFLLRIGKRELFWSKDTGWTAENLG
jgi:hypothetical protein